MNAAQRIFEIIDAKPDVVEKENPEYLDIKGDIVLKDVCFGYEPNKSVLKNIGFSVKAGEMLGIVGKSGAGKSTLVNLISRLYDVESGEITLDGVNIKDIAFSSCAGGRNGKSKPISLWAQSPRISHMQNPMPAAWKSCGRHGGERPPVHMPAAGRIRYHNRFGRSRVVGRAAATVHCPRHTCKSQNTLLDEATASVDTETERHSGISRKADWAEPPYLLPTAFPHCGMRII